MNSSEKNAGFTLLEVIIAMGIALVVIAAIYGVYISNLKTNTKRSELVGLQQNARASFLLMTDDIKLAGYNFDPSSNSAVTGFTIGECSNTVLQFTMLNPEQNEATQFSTVRYELGNDTDGNSVIFRTAKEDCPLKSDKYVDVDHCTAEVFEKSAIAENIVGLSFIYILSDGTRITVPTSTNASADGTPEDKQIKAVETTILVRTGKEDQDFVDNASYTPPQPTSGSISDWSGGTDHYHKRMITQTVFCRNLNISKD